MVDLRIPDNPDALFADGFEAAYIGAVQQFSLPPVACYDYDLCIGILVAEGLSEDDACEHMSFNVTGAWVGENTPMFLHRP